MSNEENVTAALHHLLSLPENSTFYEEYSSKNVMTSTEDVDKFFIAFKAYLTEQGRWTENEDLTVKMLKEQASIVRHQNATTPIFSIDFARKINDEWIKEFCVDFNKSLTGDKYAEEVYPKTYKTFTENIIVHAVDGVKLSEVYDRYAKFNHPFVNYTVSDVLTGSKNYSQGIPFLRDALLSACSYPNFYWNSQYGIEGGAWAISNILSLVGVNAFYSAGKNQLLAKLLKLTFLYYSRYIYMTKSNLKSMDFYSNRARLVKNNYMEFISIFPVGVNPDIQFISDMYLAWRCAIDNGMPEIQPIKQFYWDSMKMYRHGSLIPNNSGGYMEIEDRTWMELVRVGEIRSIMLADKLLKDFSNYELNLSKEDIDFLCCYVIDNLKDDVENHFRKIAERKLGGDKKAR